MIANPVWIAANTAMEYHVESKDNYYKQEGDLGIWQGKGAKALGFEGAITEKELENALWGKNKNGEQVVNTRLDEKGDRKRAALDLTFNAPKSVSILFEIANATGNKEFADKIVTIFNECVSHSLDKFEKIIQTRETDEGKSNTYFSNNLAIAKFTHSIARPVKNEDGSYSVDPSLHTHAVVMNMTQAKDGTFRAIETEQLYREYMKIGSLFRMDFAYELHNKLGLDIDIINNKQAFFEVKLSENTPQILNEFEKRSDQINDIALIKELQTKYPNKSMNEIKQLAAYATREWKGAIDRKKVEQDNLHRAENVGFGKDVFEAVLAKSYENLTHKQKTQDQNIPTLLNNALEILEEEKSVFTNSDVLEIAGKLGFKNLTNIKAIEDELQTNKNIVRLNQTTLTTKNILNAERDLIESVEKTKKIKQKFLVRDAKAVVNDFSVLKKEETGFGLTKGQSDAVVHILSSTEQIIGIQGDAGTGKTTALDALNQLKEEDTKLIGLSYTGKAANEIELKTACKSKAIFEESGIESFTIASFLNTKVGDANNLKQFNDLKIIVDEASMLGTKDAQKLIDKALELNAQLILMGDEKQFKAIGAGDPFGLLKDYANMKTINMKESIRQKNPLLKGVVKKLNALDSKLAFEMLDNAGKIHETDDGVGALVDAYFQTENTKLALISGKDTLKQNVILTNVNNLKDKLNDGIRERFFHEGILQDTQTKFNVRKSANLRPIEHFFAESYENNKATHLLIQDNFENLKKGQELKIVKINQNDDVLTVKDPKGTFYSIDLQKYGKFVQAYIEEEKSFSEKERIVFLKNDKKLGINNGEMGTIKSFDKNGNMTVTIDDKNEISFNIKNYNYLDYGYAITTMKSQGMSADNVLAYMDANAQNFNSFYVTATRAINSLHLWTNNKETLKDKIQILDMKENATTFLEQRQEHKKRKIDAFKEKSMTKDAKLIFQAKKIVSNLFLNTDIDKMSKQELTAFIKQHSRDYEKVKKEPLPFLLNFEQSKLTRSQKIKLNTELAKMINLSDNASGTLKIWGKMEEVEPLGLKEKEAILNKFFIHFEIKNKFNYEQLEDKSLIYFQNDAEKTLFKKLLNKTKNLKEKEIAQQTQIKKVKDEVAKGDFKSVAQFLKSNLKELPECDLKSINRKISNMKVAHENKNKSNQITKKIESHSR